jgi:SEC-C motif-containing protein
MSYEGCCARWHAGSGHLQAPTAEALMRSRYSAFVKKRADYLQDTWHPSTRPAEPVHFEAGLQWLGLEVKSHRALSATQAEVTFVARSKSSGRAQRLQETSRFERINGRWYYVDGEIS